MTRLTSSFYDMTEILPIERGMALQVEIADSEQPLEVVRMNKYGETEPEGIYAECARQLFAYDKQAWKDSIIQIKNFTVGASGTDSHVTLRHASQLAFCFHQGLDRLDDAYTLNHYGEYQLFCQLNGLGVSCWEAEEYYEAFKVLDEPFLLGNGSREPGGWYIKSGNGSRYGEGTLVDCIKEIKDLPLNWLTELMELSYQNKYGIVTDCFRLPDVQLLAGLVNPNFGSAEHYVADWIEKGVANFLVAFHYDELLDRLRKARMGDLCRASTFESFVARNKAIKCAAMEKGTLSWPHNMEPGGTPTKEALLGVLSQDSSQFIERLVQVDRARFVHGLKGFSSDELMELLVAYAQKTGLPLESVYDRLPSRLGSIALPKESWPAYRLDLARYVKGDPSSLAAGIQLGRAMRLSPEDWHILVVKEPAALQSLPHEVICDWKFWHPMTDLARLGEPLKQLIPEGFYHDPEFQRHALMSGLVELEELGSEVFGINADDYRKVLAYPGLSATERMSEAYVSAALGVVLHDPNDVVLLPEKALSQEVLFVAAYHDVDLLNRGPENSVRFLRLSNSQLQQALLAQTNNADEVARFAERVPKCYRTASVFEMLQERLGLYGEPERIQREAFMGGSERDIEQGARRSMRNRL